MARAGVERVLTSGCDSTCLEGLDTLARLVHQAGPRIIVVPGGGITERNIKRIIRYTHPAAEPGA